MGQGDYCFHHKASEPLHFPHHEHVFEKEMFAGNFKGKKLVYKRKHFSVFSSH